MTVTKRDLVLRLSEKLGLTQREVFQIIEQMTAEITESLSEGDEVVFRNFGTFQTGINKPKIGRNPMKPEVDLVIPARRVVRFRMGKYLKEQVDDE
ncbi:MAG: integration host factor subunit beta [Verrucomicrobiales bacterium]|nr:integration host factor subunit beta [Verrucomicrobiales bacterium]